MEILMEIIKEATILCRTETIKVMIMAIEMVKTLDRTMVNLMVKM